MKISLLILITGFIIGVHALNIPITVHEAVPTRVDNMYIPGLARTDEPVTAGIPLDDADNITDISQLGLSGSAVGQFRALRRYLSGNIQWVLCDFQATVAAKGSTQVTLTDGSGNFGGADLGSDSGAYIQIKTGAADFIIKKKNFNVLHSATIQGQSMLSDTTGTLISTDSLGTVYNSIYDNNSTAVLEENGPAKAVVKAMGRMMDSQGNGHVWYTVRLYFYKDKTRVRMDITIRNAELSFQNPQFYKNFQVALPLSFSGDPSFAFIGKAKTQEWTGSVPSGQSAYIFQGFTDYLAGTGVTLTGTTNSTWPDHMVPLPGTRSGGDFNVSPAYMGLKVVSGAQVLQNFGNRSDFTLGYADFSDSNNKGASVAIRWMSGFWPASFDIHGDGKLEIGLFSKHNPKHVTANWGSHETRQVMVDFHLQNSTGEPALYHLQYPLLGRAPFEQYRKTKSFYGQDALVTMEQEREYYLKYGFRLNTYSNELNAIYRAEWWRRGYAEHEHRFLQYLRSGLSSYYLNGEQRVQFNADRPTIHSDNFDLRKHPTIQKPLTCYACPPKIGDWGQNMWDVHHEMTMSFPIAYYITGDERIREAALDYGEWRLHQTINRSGEQLPQRPNSGRPYVRRIKNLSWLYEFTRDTAYINPILATVSFLIDEEAPEGTFKKGRDLNRGYFFLNIVNSSQPREMTPFAGVEIRGECLYQCLRVLKQNNDVIGYNRIEEWEDALLGCALWLVKEGGIVNGVYHHIGYGHLLDQPNPWDSTSVSGDQLRYARKGSYTFARWHNIIYDALGDTQYFHNEASVQLYLDNNAIHSQNQAQMYYELFRPTPEYGWKDITFNATDQGSGSYQLDWTVPSGATAYKIKYAEKEIIEWLGFDQMTRQYQYSPSQYVPWFSAANVSDEPTPAGPGTSQSYTITGLDQAKTWYFSVKYSTSSYPGFRIIQIPLNQRPGSGFLIRNPDLCP
jgi:hypothetical protein